MIDRSGQVATFADKRRPLYVKICNQQVIGSDPIAGSLLSGGFPGV
jgi:hypothetical protein